MSFNLSPELLTMPNSTTLPLKELHAVIFALEKFKSYLGGTEVIILYNHVALSYFLEKKCKT